MIIVKEWKLSQITQEWKLTYVDWKLTGDKWKLIKRKMKMKIVNSGWKVKIDKCGIKRIDV